MTTISDLGRKWKVLTYRRLDVRLGHWRIMTLVSQATAPTIEEGRGL